MYLPRLENENTRKSVQYDFRGYNHNLFVDDNEFYDEQNMTSKYWPVLSPRNEYYKVYQISKDPEESFTNLQGFIGDGNENALFVDNDKLYYNNTLKYTFTLTGRQRKMISYGGYVVIVPDMVLFNWDTKTVESMCLTQHPDNTYYAIYDLCNKDGTGITYSSGNTAPVGPSDGDYWVDTSSSPYVLKRWSEYNSMWSSVPNTYVQITVPGYDWGFSAGDGVTISNTSVGFDGDYILENVIGDMLIVKGIIDNPTSQNPAGLTVERKVPSMDYMCAHNNRLWGCSNTNHEIYACKLGDPKNWYSYAGISTDSYALTIPEETRFTGCVAYRGSVLFFKERKIYKIYGTKPSNFQLSDTLCSGVADGCSGSICVIDEVLYYAGIDGIYAYDGSMPRLISRGAINRDWEIIEANGGSDGIRYYVSLWVRDIRNCMLEYDTQTGIWSRVDDSIASNFTEFVPGVLAFFEDQLFAGIYESVFATASVTSTTIPILPRPYLTSGSLVGRYVLIGGNKYKIVSNTNSAITLNSAATVTDYQEIFPADRVIRCMKYTGKVGYCFLKKDDSVDWFAETGDISRYSTNRGTAYDVNRHYLSKIQIRTELNAGSTFCVALQYDHGDWEEVYCQEAPADKSEKRYTYVIPIIPHRCDTVKMKLYGTGVCKIFAVARLYEQGSEI